MDKDRWLAIPGYNLEDHIQLVSNFARHCGKVERVSLSFIWAKISRAINGVSIGDGGVEIGIFLLE